MVNGVQECRPFLVPDRFRYMTVLSSLAVLERRGPEGPEAPVVVDSPHSGEVSPPDFRHAISPERLRMTADAYVDELFSSAPALGATFLRALFPRTYIDPNRSVDDIDIGMLDGTWPDPIAPGPKVRQGIGLVASRDLYGPIYRRSLSVQEVRERIENYYQPYHRALSGAIDRAWSRHGFVLHLNCHSMRTQWTGRVGGRSTVMDMCVGDQDGDCASREARDLVVDVLAGQGYRVAVNSPYKGMELVRRYSAPEAGRHSIQLEISRGLYMNENLVEKHEGFGQLRSNMGKLVEALCVYARTKTGIGSAAAE